MSEKLFNRGIQIIDIAEDDLSSAVIRSEKDLYDEILKIFENVTITNGKLSSNEKTDEFLLSLDRRIAKALKNSGYTSSVDKYLINFDKVAENVKKIQESVNGINLLASQIDPYKRIEVSNTWDNLLGSGVNKSFVQPVRQGLYRNIMFGASVSDVEKLVKDFVITKKDADSKLLRYVKQVSRDSLSQFDGGLQQKIASELNLNAIRYVGSLIVDSRAQCRKWTNSGVILLNDEFEKEIQKAIDGNLYFDGQKSSGMIKETTLSNFMANRGGWNCRHRAIATKIINKQQTTKIIDLKNKSVLDDYSITLNNATLYRGDIRDKGEKFNTKNDTKDYLMDGKYKNEAGFHWFTDKKEYATEYATKQMSELRGEIEKPIITEISTKKLKILDLKKLDLKGQVSFIKSLSAFSEKNKNETFKYLLHNQKKLLEYNGVIDESTIDKILGYKTYGNILSAGQVYSDFEKGIEFKKWLIENGFDGYKFQMFKAGEEIGLINADDFIIKDRIILK